MTRERFDVVETVIGTIVIAVSDKGVSRLDFDWAPFDGIQDSAAVAGVAEQLGEYFAGRRTSFDLDVDLSGVSDFTREVLEACARIPFGETRTYADLAIDAGNPRASRAVGGALNRNPVGIIIPCHRVIGSTGDLTGFAGGLHRKRALLTLERRGPEALDHEWPVISGEEVLVASGPKRVPTRPTSVRASAATAGARLV